MKNMMISALLALMLLMPVCAAAEGISLDGQIEAVMTRTIAAPHTGIEVILPFASAMNSPRAKRSLP